MASPKAPNQIQNQFDMQAFFPPYPPPPTTTFLPYPPPPPPPLPPDPHANMHVHRLVPYPPPPLHPDAGPQILALLNNNNKNNNKPVGSDCWSKMAKGRRVSGDYVAYDVDLRFEGEREPLELEVTPITKYGSDPELVIGKQIAVNKHYIVYGLKGGNVRVLNLNTASRSLFRGHTKRVTDMAFFADDVHLLASVSVEGRVYVWKILEDPDEEDKPQITRDDVVAIQFFGGEGGREGDYVHPRLCWHCNRQDVLVVGLGKCLLRIDTTEVGKAEGFSGEAALECSIDGLIDGVQLVGKHDGEITDLSMCQWTITRLVSASTDGTIKIWEDGKAVPLAVLKPHGGQPVNSASFLTAPHQAGHVILITAGPRNREVKLWTSASEEGWLLPGNTESWKCTQTLELKSSAESQVDEAFFNQVAVLSQVGLLFIANAKKNTIYSVHLEFGTNPAVTRMDYIAEFKVTMPILSFTGTTDPPGESKVKLYCVQTQAIQQYALDLCQCLPSRTESLLLESSDSSVSHDRSNVEGLAVLDLNGSKITALPFPSSVFKPNHSESATGLRYPLCSTSLEGATLQESTTSKMESKPISLARTASDTNVVCVASPPLPLSPRLSRKLSGFRNLTNSSELGPSHTEHVGSQPIVDYSVDRRMDTIHAKLSDMHSDAKCDDNKMAPKDITRVLNPSFMFKHPTHLITPSEILKSASSSETINIIEGKDKEEVNIQDVVVTSDVGNAELEVKVVGETRAILDDEFGSQGELQNLVSGNREKLFCSQASDLGIEMAREFCAIITENYVVEEAQVVDGGDLTEQLAQSSYDGEAEFNDSTKDLDGKASESLVTTTIRQLGEPSMKGKKERERNSQVSAHSYPSSSVSNSAGSFRELRETSSLPSAQTEVSQIMAMRNLLNQVMTMQKELQKQMRSSVTLPVTDEGRRLEASIGRGIEKAVKASIDALWARFQEENAKNEKFLRDRTHQITSLITNVINKDLIALLEKTVKKELAAVGPAIVRTVTPTIEKTISSSIAESFQRGVGDKAVNLLERSVNTRLEATVGRQIQAQFQTSGKQALQDALKSSVEASVLPAFEKSCKSMFEQVDANFQKGMVEHTSAALQNFESAYCPLALALRDSITSASSMAQTLSGELGDVQRKLLNLAAVGPNSNAGIPLVPQLSNGSLHGLHDKVEMPLDPKKELSRLISEWKYEEAFTIALQKSDVSIVSWLCLQVDPRGILSMVPLPLSQGVLLSLLQQLACDINKDTTHKLAWITDLATAIIPTDPVIATHGRPIFQQVYQRLHHQCSSPTVTAAELSSIRLLMHVINSMMMTSK